MLILRCRNYFLNFLVAMFIGGTIPAYGDSLSDEDIRQKLRYAETLINTSDTAKRVLASDNAEARSKYQSARQHLEQAHSALDNGDLQTARSNTDDAMNQMFQAAQLVPSEHAVKIAKDRYDRMLKSIETLETSYMAALAQTGDPAEPGLDLDSVRRKMTEATRLADDGKHDEANRRLNAVMNELSAALNSLHGSKTISYEMIFDSPADEYAYEVKRYLSLEEAIPLAIEQMHPDQADIDKAQSYIDRASAERREADATAGRGDHEKALLLIKDATMQVETALTVLGVTY